MLEDKLLVWKFNRGEPETLHRIYEKYKDNLMTLAAALLYDKNAAEDAVHDVFVTLIKSCGKLQFAGNLKGYLTACVVNCVRNKNKAGQRHQRTSLEYAEPIAPDSTMPDLAVMFGEQSQRLAKAISQLPYDQREVLLLHLYSGLKFKAIANLQGESINTIQGRYRYGLDKLRTILNHESIRQAQDK